MSMQILIDMNLSPDWVAELAKHGWSATHWTAVGDPRATDREIMDWARSNSFVVSTHDLDFGTMLALTHASGPSVVQVRGQNILPDHIASIIELQYEDKVAGLWRDSGAGFVAGTT